MKLIIDIPDSDYTAVRCEALYYIGHDKLAKSVTTAFQAAIPYEEPPQGEWLDEGEQYVDYRCEHSYMCTNCGWHIIEIPELISGHRFCKHCGADMRGDKEE